MAVAIAAEGGVDAITGKHRNFTITLKDLALNPWYGLKKLDKMPGGREPAVQVPPFSRGVHRVLPFMLSAEVFGEKVVDYLGQQIEVVEADLGWVGIWHHHLAGRIEIKFFAAPQEALELVMDLIRQDLAVVSLLRLLDEWREDDTIDEWEHRLAAESLVQSVLAVLS